LRETHFSKFNSYVACAIIAVLCFVQTHIVTIPQFTDFFESVLSTEDYYRRKLCHKKEQFCNMRHATVLPKGVSNQHWGKKKPSENHLPGSSPKFKLRMPCKSCTHTMPKTIAKL
jgi:hypothetical protein